MTPAQRKAAIKKQREIQRRQQQAMSDPNYQLRLQQQQILQQQQMLLEQQRQMQRQMNIYGDKMGLNGTGTFTPLRNSFLPTYMQPY